jgi:glycerophosphoryl diester phosphodiesterase
MSARHRHLTATAVLAAAIVPAGVAAAHGGHDHHAPLLTGRAVLPVETYAPGPPAGAAVPTATNDPDGDGVINGIRFPTPSQPVEGFSGIVDGRHGEILAMADNGFGSKANSKDFHIRAYVLRPDFKTAHRGTGTVEVGSYIEFTDPDDLIGFRIEHEGVDRVLTGADIDPESLQQAPDGTLWVGDEFGPWVLHFSAAGELLHAPYRLPGALYSPNNPTVPQTTPPTSPVANSRGIEAMAMTPDGRTMYVVLEGAVVGDSGNTRRVYEFDVREGRFTEQRWTYLVDADNHLVADAQALNRHRLLLIERDAGLGVNALFRSVFEVDLRDVDGEGTLLHKTEVVDLAAIPDPDGISLPPIHGGDVGLGDPFRVTCESIEALRILSPHRLLLGCDNNFPNTGRNPALADDNELITVRI